MNTDMCSTLPKGLYRENIKTDYNNILPVHQNEHSTLMEKILQRYAQNSTMGVSIRLWVCRWAIT